MSDRDATQILGETPGTFLQPCWASVSDHPPTPSGYPENLPNFMDPFFRWCVEREEQIFSIPEHWANLALVYLTLDPLACINPGTQRLGLCPDHEREILG